jgi:hypothetical protein
MNKFQELLEKMKEKAKERKEAQAAFLEKFRVNFPVKDDKNG